MVATRVIQSSSNKLSTSVSDCAKCKQIKFDGGGYPCSIMVKAMDCGIVVSDFELQSRYHVPFRTNTLGKGMNPLIFPSMG